MDNDQIRYASKPTRFTVYQRTFLPLQIWRFAVINLKMIGIIRRSHHAMKEH
ncbi:MAG: hypothetical protein ACP5H2_04815 [Solirubrobacteraceae bacterium]